MRLDMTGGKCFAGHFTHPKVRMAAAARIAIADDKELLGYLLQLVQALRYEPVAHHNADSLLNLLGLNFPRLSCLFGPMRKAYHPLLIILKLT
jgi:hypothetical protein